MQKQMPKLWTQTPRAFGEHLLTRSIGEHILPLDNENPEKVGGGHAPRKRMLLGLGCAVCRTRLTAKGLESVNEPPNPNIEALIIIE